MFDGLVRFIGKLRAPRTLEGVLDAYEAGRHHPVLPPLFIALGEFVASRPVESRAAWRALLLHLDEIAGAEPTKKWMTQLRTLVAQVDADDLEALVFRWFSLIDLAACDFSRSFTKGLVWVTACLNGDRVAPELGALAERANRKIAGRGQMSRSVVNACLRVLAGLDSELAVLLLTRLKGVIEYRDANQQLDQAFETAATKRELSVDQLEERVVPDVGGLTAPIGAWTPTITFEDGAPRLSWVRDDGKRVQRVPAELQREHSDEVTARKAKFSEFEEVLEAQAGRLERLFWTQRLISLADFREHTLGHPVVMQRHNPVPRLRNTVVRDRLPELEELLNRLLAKNEADRPANARVVVNELQSLLRQFERRNERTNVGVDPRRLLEAKPTDVLPKPSPEAEAAFLARPQPAPSEAEPRTTRSRAFLILPVLFIALGVAWGVSRLFQDPVVIDEPKPVLPPIVLPPPVVLPVLEPVDSGSSGEELAPVNPVIVQKVKPPPVRTCVPNQAWRDRMKLDLDDLESKGTNMGAAELERAIESLYLSMKSAKSPEDCGRVEHRFEELVKKAIK